MKDILDFVEMFTAETIQAAPNAELDEKLGYIMIKKTIQRKKFQ